MQTRPFPLDLLIVCALLNTIWIIQYASRVPPSVRNVPLRRCVQRENPEPDITSIMMNAFLYARWVISLIPGHRCARLAHHLVGTVMQLEQLPAMIVTT